MQGLCALFFISTTVLCAQECPNPQHEAYAPCTAFDDSDENGCACQRNFDCRNNGYFEQDARSVSWPGQRTDAFYDDLTR